MAFLLLSRPLFVTGQIVTTAGVHDLLQQGRFDPAIYLHRHFNGDWGDLCDDDRRANDEALACGDRLFSSYEVTSDLKVWIITEWDRSVTTLLLPDEY